MLNVAFVRGNFINKNEWQNYSFKNRKVKITPISSLRPLHIISNTKKFLSLKDLSKSKSINFILNRTLGDSQILFGLNSELAKYQVFDTADPHYYYSYQLAKYKAKQKLITTYCDTIPFNNESTKQKKYIKNYVMKKTDLFICHTKRSKICILKEGYRNTKIVVLNLGVDLNKFKPRKVNKKSIKILYVGRLVREKGVLDLYSSFKKCLINSKQPLKLIFCGDGDLKHQIINNAIKDQIRDKILFTSSNYENIHKIYNYSDILVVPSIKTKTWEEQYGMVLVEGLASGIPIIAYESGSIPEVLHNKGILIKSRDKNGLTNKLLYLLENKNLRNKLAMNGRKFAEKRYNSIDYQRKIQNIYLSTL